MQIFACIQISHSVPWCNCQCAASPKFWSRSECICSWNAKIVIFACICISNERRFTVLFIHSELMEIKRFYIITYASRIDCLQPVNEANKVKKQIWKSDCFPVVIESMNSRWWKCIRVQLFSVTSNFLFTGQSICWPEKRQYANFKQSRFITNGVLVRKSWTVMITIFFTYHSTHLLRKKKRVLRSYI